MAKVRYNIMLSPNVVELIDLYAADNHSSRSEIIDTVLSDFCIENELFRTAPEPDPDQMTFEEVIW